MCRLMATVDVLQAEARERPRMVVVAAIGAVLSLLSPAFQIGLLRDQPDNVPAQLIYRGHHQLGSGLASGCLALSFFAIGIVLDFVMRATLARNPDAPRWLRVLPLLGVFGLGIVTAASEVVTGIGVAHFASHGSQTYDEARAVTNTGALAYLGILLVLVYVGAVVTTSIMAMRVGLLTRLLAYVGIGASVLLILQPPAAALLEIYWLGALAVLFAGRWPSGTPAAWRSGEAVPWPSNAELRERRVRAAEARRGGGGRGKPASQPEAIEGAETEVASSGPSPATSKRKRKRRR
jgi:hypothetical protein